ncbi:MAG TPA: AAA family ATPase [Candidatus Saccharimonadales bacterium]|nr:AAA family ATPase [Candidatus Saccharimonadales bacterium]
MEITQPILFYTIGYPGSGKTTFAISFSKDSNAEHLYADKLGIQIFQTPRYSQEERKHVLEEMDWLALTNLQGNVGVVYDANINSFSEREHLRDIAKKANTVAVGIWIKTPISIAKRRLSEIRRIGNVNIRQMTDKNRANNEFKKIVNRFEAPRSSEMTLMISGIDPYDQQLKEIGKSLRNIQVK